MSTNRTRARGSASPHGKVVNLTSYRAARQQEADALPLFAQPMESAPAARPLSATDVAHRERMLRHLSGGTDRR